jgi:phospholipid-binding lipoprotein MlaA
MLKYSSSMRGFVLALAAAFSLSACADYTNTPSVKQSAQVDADESSLDEDPLEPMNRAFFRGNKTLDQVILRPIAYVYNSVVPDVGRRAVSNFLDNVQSPVVFANSALQGDVNNSFAVFWRFVINTTVGLGGINDVAASGGLKARDADFGQTLATYGVPSGAYIVLPLIGPGTLRDTSGRGVDLVLDPVTWAHDDAWGFAKAGANGVDFRSNNMRLLDDLYNNSVDPYATFRSAYLQRRAKEVGEAFRKTAAPK